MSTHNICFREEIRKIIFGYPLLSGAVDSYTIFILNLQTDTYEQTG